MSMSYSREQNAEAAAVRQQLRDLEIAERDARHSMRLASLQKRLIVSERIKRSAESAAARLMQEVVEAHGR